MDSSTTATQKPNPNNGVYHIGGLPVEFPYKPYGSQLAFMGRVISTLDRGQRQGHCHALLESPTGTGKSLSLLCSALAWQKNYKAKNLYSNLSHSKPNPEAMSDPLACGGGFVPEPEPEPSSSNLEPGNLELDPSSKNSRSKKQKTTPTIFYASRTHSQITQVIREYRKTSYRVPMAVLASRKHYCTNRHVCGKENLDEECKTLLKANKLPGQHQDVGCLEFKNAHKVKAHPSLQRGGCNEVHDIEDLVKVGRLVKGCSYFAARDMSDEAQIVFCPYSYILNPAIRKAMEVDIKESIVILDEAHNIEDIARDAGSVDVEEEVLYSLQTELRELCFTDAMIYQPLYDTIQEIISWIGQRISTLEKREFQHYFSCWTGDKALSELQQVGISQQCFPILQECAAKAIKAATDGESEAPHLSGMSVTTLEGLFSALGYFFSGNGLHALDYQLALRRYVKKDAGQTSGGWTQSLSLWCLNPAVVFREIADLSMSVILTSGTLSPMNSFSSELGVQFETCMEAPHVIDVESQLWAAVVSTGPGNYPLNASYKTADGFAFQDSLGASLEEICKIVPGGALVFFPSYKLMEKLCNRWRETGQWSRLTTQKSLFVEPRGNQGDFESVLKEYYESIRRGNKPAPRKIKREKKRDINHFYAKDTPQYGGAAFLAVCRGKVSEGIDFSDENARVVVLVGIPFPNINDVKVAQKKKYNDTFSSSKNLLSGSQWYCHQAFRAMNQAAGRCIRHRFDYGAIILMDERFREERNIAYVSKWLRKSIKQYDSFDMSMEGLRSFFQDAKERFGQKVTANVENSDLNEESTPSTEQKNLSKWPAKRKVQKCCKLDQPNGPKVVSKDIIAAGKAGQRLLPRSLTSLRNDGATFPKLNAQSIDEAKTFTQADEYETGNCRGYNFGYNAHKDTRSESSISMASCDTPGSLSTVKGTPYVSDNIDMSSPTVLSNEDNSNSTNVEATNEFSDQLSFHSAARANSSGAVTEDTCALGSTPERTMNNDICNLKPEMESSLNLSVNSHTTKRRKPVTSSLPNYSEMDKCRTPDAHSPLVECMRTKSVSRDAIRRIEFEFEAGPDYKKHSQTRIVNNRDALSLCSDVAMDQRLHICCSICKNSLGLPENQFLVTCSVTSSSKVHLTSFLESGSNHLSINGSEGIPVVISDVSSVNTWLYYNMPIRGSTSKHGIWCEKDGCVFNTVFCPFCTVPNNILGFQVKATDAQNIQLQNKILFYFNSLEIRNKQEPKVECCLPVSGSDLGQSVKGSDIGPVVKDSDCEQDDFPSIEKFRYSTQQPSSGGWRTTRSKLRLPRKRASKTENHYGTQR